ncbi:glycoside hydrolase family 172 protein [Luteipulveratus mongoliensis]|uniref:DUF2961 domain-containing protein n=1 Tax=Luteipulveratus mongoliensis TaxID=571913 RepID=A0A0K1JKG8_9MICO|nr:glycoside hydrolase family 172 protein [Luteipulveratus mongoliensis]AKU17093.1 hypothetical protein VV02_16540 [Luteipulveratus mongoliensis]
MRTHPRSRRRAATIAVAAVLVTALGSAGPAPAATQPSSPDRKGPVGWDTYRHLDQIGTQTAGVETKQFSSFDRAGGNDDGFEGTYSCLRTATDGCVIAERAGAGEVDSIWFTRDGGDVSRTGSIKVELDGKVVLNAPVQDVVDGKIGGAFVQPFVTNADQSSGGVNIHVPMTYRSSMRVTTTTNPLFYHVTYRTFADSKGVSTFDPKAVPNDVLKTSRTWGQADPKPARQGSTTAKPITLKPGASAVLADAYGPGQVSALRLQLPQIVGPKTMPLIADDGRAHKGDSQFTVAINPDNDGVQLKRRFDANSAQEVADIYVDDVKVGRWPATDDTAGHWSYQTFDLPASATKGKSKITVRNTFVSATIDWNEFHYWVDSVVGGAPVRTDELDVGPSPAGLASEKAHDYTITNQTWTGTPNQTDPPPDLNDPAILKSAELLRDVYVRATFDGKKTVESPLGEFFGSGLVEGKVSSLFFAMDPAPGGWYSSWWPMPYVGHARIELVNKSKLPLTSGQSQVTTSRDASVVRRLVGPQPTLGYFNATHQRADTTEGRDWMFLDTKGTGRFVGVSHTARGHITSGNIREYLEGDERVYADGSASPALHGTGSEDFYGSGWYFNRTTFSTPFNGLSGMPTRGHGCAQQCDSPYRLMIGDAVPFSSSLKFGIEHGPVDNAAAEYSSTAYWYGFTNQQTSKVTDTLNLGDAASRQTHQYDGAAPGAPLTATFEGDDDGVQVAKAVASATDPVSFTMKVDRTNQGVTLRRTSDQANAYQSAAVSINGQPAGTWLQPLGNTHHRWLDDTFQIDPALTRGRSSVRVTITPTAGAAAWTAAEYAADSAR